MDYIRIIFNFLRKEYHLLNPILYDETYPDCFNAITC
jgi:hypothetical protein